MHYTDILLTSDLVDGTAPFIHGDLRIAFHKWSPGDQVPLLEGAVWAFVDWMLPDISGLEACRRIRCDPETARAHIVVVLEQDDPEARRPALRAGACDCVVGPLTRSMVLDRVMAFSGNEAGDVNGRTIVFGDLTIDMSAFRARYRSQPLALMPRAIHR